MRSVGVVAVVLVACGSAEPVVDMAPAPDLMLPPNCGGHAPCAATEVCVEGACYKAGDMGQPADLVPAVDLDTPDMAQPDMATAPDLARPDLAHPDLIPPPDLWPPPTDLTSTADLLPEPDLTDNPDLLPPVDLTQDLTGVQCGGGGGNCCLSQGSACNPNGGIPCCQYGSLPPMVCQWRGGQARAICQIN